MRAQPTLFRRAAWLIGAGLIVFELLSMLAIDVYVLRPLQRRSADDFAALVLLSARTWVELPPETRGAFAVELATNHRLELRAGVPPAEGETPRHPVYLRYLGQSLEQQSEPGIEPRLTIAADQGYQVDVELAGHRLRFTFGDDRLNSRPFEALMLITLTAALVSVAIAWFLARRVSRPVARLAAAARRIGVVDQPTELPEDVEVELAELAHAFNQTSSRLKAQRENQDTLLAGVSHDLRSPLARLRMATGMLAEESDSPLLARMEADIVEMDALIGNQLELARMRQRETPVVTDIDAMLRDLAQAGSAKGRCVVRLRTYTTQRSSIVAPVALRRIIGNLLDNACLHGGGRDFELVRRRRGATILIGVRDRGPGVPAPLREAIFRPFFRVEPSRNRATGGSGLGLAIARQLAESHGWTLLLKSRVGGGVSFWLVIPDNHSDGPPLTKE